MRKESRIKNVITCIGYIFLVLLLSFSILVLILKSSSRENASIVMAQDSDTYFRNVNPLFTVDFVNNEYIRFESSKSYTNPFEESSTNILERIKYMLGINSKKLGLILTLEEISHDTEVDRILKEKGISTVKENNIKKNFELLQTGREIGNNQNNFVSKDTIISRNIYKGIDVEYQIISGKGLKEEIVLREIPEYTDQCEEGMCSFPANRYVFKLVLDEGLLLKKSITGLPGYPSGTHYLVDRDGNYYAHFLPEYAVDGVGSKTSKVNVDLLQGNSDNEYIFTVILDADWLMNENRVFPIRIDPSIVHDSSLSLEQGTYDRAYMDLSSSILLKDSLSGTYTSNILQLGDSVTLGNISWNSFGDATGMGEIPYSNMNLILEENFNEVESINSKWGSGSMELLNTSKSYTLTGNESNYYTLEFWLYNRYRSNTTNEIVYTTDLGNLEIVEGKYTFIDKEGIRTSTNVDVVYNRWNHIAVVYNLNSSSITLYIDGNSSEIVVNTYNKRKITELTLGGNNSIFGNIDTLRIYDRLLTRYEILSNSQYVNTYMQYRNSLDANTFSKWINSSTADLEYEEDEYGVTISSSELSSYDLLSFSYASDTDTEISLGKSKLVTGVIEDSNEPIKYIDFWFNPSNIDNYCLLSSTDLSISTRSNGDIVLSYNEKEYISTDSYRINSDNHIAIKIEEDLLSLYLNGNLSISESIVVNLTKDNLSNGVGCQNNLLPIDIESLRVLSLDTVEDRDIVEVYRNAPYKLKPVFKAKLQKNSILSSYTDTKFSISELDFGASNYIVNLNIKDTIVIHDGEYKVEGEVKSINNNTGLIEVINWKGTFPTNGFTESSRVYKWQTEYLPIKNYIDISNPIDTLYLRYNKELIYRIEVFSTIKKDDIEQYSKSSGNENLQYRIILTSKYQSLTPYLVSVNINYEIAGPSMDQVMRHGKWFLDGEKQSFWWAN
jgi:hypothetical protein